MHAQILVVMEIQPTPSPAIRPAWRPVATVTWRNLVSCGTMSWVAMVARPASGSSMQKWSCECSKQICHEPSSKSFPFVVSSHYGNVELCRKILNRGVNSASDDPELMVERLLQFEREEGDLGSFETALVKCASQMRRVEERREKVSDQSCGTRLDRTTCM